jgi:hypothetical protein
MRQTFKYLEMRARLALPMPLRQLLRAVRSMKPAQGSQALPPELIKDCRFLASREALLEALPANGMVAELGTYKGDFARNIVSINKPRELHLIDITYSHFEERGLTGPTVKRHEGLTHEVISRFPDGHFDWAYVDADHSYAGVSTDARAAAPKIRPGGFLVFGDFTHSDAEGGRYGVHRAVVDFTIESGWSMCYFAYSPHALYEVALRKPAP